MGLGPEITIHDTWDKVPYTVSVTRWQPNPAQRLHLAALELFAERGYENTTVIDIAQHAGLTKSTFFRHYQDKREVLFGGDTMPLLVAEAIKTAPPGTTPLEAVAQAMDAIWAETFTPDRREYSARRRAVIDANPELQEREALKMIALTASMTSALRGRGVPELTACITAKLGALAWEIADKRWSEAATGDDDFGQLARQALREVQEASTHIGVSAPIQ
jgi:AcrR family transcriptional regulator